MSPTHTERVREAFSTQAQSFEDERFKRVFTSDARWLFERLALAPEDVLLDVAAGTGHAARSLAPRVRFALAVDLTPAMLDAGKAAAAGAAIDNLLFQIGDAAALPFLEASFDVVLTRFALHHIEDPGAVVREMARCARPGGTVAIGDMVAVDAPGLAVSQNRLERLRDPSHARALGVRELGALCGEAGLEEVVSEVRTIAMPLERWLAQAHTPPASAEVIRAEIRAEIAGGAATGLDPFEQDGVLWLSQPWASLVARKPSP